MRRATRSLLLVGLALLAAFSMTACAQEPTAVEPAQDAVEEQADQTQESVDSVLNTAQDTVSELITVGAGLETRIDGLQINSDLQEIQRKLTSAIEGAGDKKVAALEEVSDAYNTLIYRVDTAAAKLPEGGAVRTELEDFSAKLKDAQVALADAAASYEASSTDTP